MGGKTARNCANSMHTINININCNLDCCSSVKIFVPQVLFTMKTRQPSINITRYTDHLSLPGLVDHSRPALARGGSGGLYLGWRRSQVAHTPVKTLPLTTYVVGNNWKMKERSHHLWHLVPIIVNVTLKMLNIHSPIGDIFTGQNWKLSFRVLTSFVFSCQYLETKIFWENMKQNATSHFFLSAFRKSLEGHSNEAGLVDSEEDKITTFQESMHWYRMRNEEIIKDFLHFDVCFHSSWTSPECLAF